MCSASSIYRGFPVIFGVIIATAVVPFEVYMIPLYLNVQSAGLLNTCPGSWSAIS